jgi:hypothetical protein
VTAAVMTTACGGGGGSSSPSPNPGPAGPNTIAITSSGVSPRNITVNIGDRVTFRNDSPVVHEMGSDPHPDHTDCPEINQVGRLNPGQSRETGNLVIARTCGFHDHDRPTDTSLQGTITTR